LKEHNTYHEKEYKNNTYFFALSFLIGPIFILISYFEQKKIWKKEETIAKEFENEFILEKNFNI